MSDGQFEKLLSPVQIGKIKLRNRIVKAPQSTRFTEPGGFVGQRHKDFYGSLSRGGVSMIILGAVSISAPPKGEDEDLIAAWDDKFIPKLSELAQAVHEHGGTIWAQFNDRAQASVQTLTSVQPISSSTLSEDELPSPTPNFFPPRELSIQEVKDFIEKFVDAAERIQKAGIDGIELHGAHSYLLEGFLSRVWNKRQDEYGAQNLQNRTRMVVEILQKIKGRMGKDYPVGVRINGEEFGVANGITSEESVAIAKLLEEAGADYISVSGFGYGERPWKYIPDHCLYPEPMDYMKPFIKRFKKPGILIPAAEAIKKVVSVPVIGVGNMTPELAEQVLQQGKVDLIAFGRPLFADPEIANKLAAGRPEDIAPCTHCATCYPATDVPRRCRINAALEKGREYDENYLKPAKKRKKVMVVGGGVAGMEAARIATLRGHDVSLYDRESKLGGLLPLASLIKGLEVEDLPAITRYFKTQLTKLGVKVNLGMEVNQALVDTIKPDAVVVATGGVPTIPSVPGIQGRNVLSSAELHRRVKTPLRLFGPRFLGWLTKFYLPIGKRVIVMGGSIQGCETAEFLVKRGRKVTVVETSDQMATGIPAWYTQSLLHWFSQKGVRTMTGVKYEQITDKGLTLTTKDGKKETIEADTIVVTMLTKPNTELLDAIKEKVPEVYTAGGAKGPESNLIVECTAEARGVGCSV
ncbi:FAD-dependent oxidoreductase [Chloroflexota bacterium]